MVKYCVPLVDILDVSTQHSRFHIGTSSSKQDIVGMPIQTQYRTPDRFLQQSTNPPITFGVE